MKIKNIHNVVIEIYCDRCNQAIAKDKYGYYVGVLVTEIPSMECKDYCTACNEYLKQVMDNN